MHKRAEVAGRAVLVLGESDVGTLLRREPRDWTLIVRCMSDVCSAVAEYCYASVCPDREAFEMRRGERVERGVAGEYTHARVLVTRGVVVAVGVG